MKIGTRLSAVAAICLMLNGCAHTLYEKSASEQDLGSKTELKLKGPKVAVEHQF